MIGYRISNTSSNFINFLRAISSQLVMITHAFHASAFLHLSEHSPFLRLAGYSVLVFFVLSGYVISYSTMKKGKSYGLSNYIIDRFSRIYIVLVPTFLFTYLLAIAYYTWFKSYPYDINVKRLITCLLMQQDNLVLQKIQYMLPNLSEYKFMGYFGDNGPLWSLSIEWWHYMFFGVFFYINFHYIKLTHYFLFVCSLPFVIGYCFFPGQAGNGLSFIWFSGVLINFLLQQKINFKKAHLLSIIFLLLTISSFMLDSSLKILFFIIFFLCSLVHFNSLADSNNYNRFFLLAKWPSNYSYSLYIIHYPILLLIHRLTLTPVLSFILVVVISNLMALILYLTFEKHHNFVSTTIKNFFKKKQFLKNS